MSGPTLEWIIQKPDMNTQDNGYAPKIAVDADGNSYVVYYVSGTVSGGTQTINGYTPVVVKIDTNSSIVWISQEVNTAPTTDNYTNLDTQIAIDTEGNCYVSYTIENGNTASGGVSAGASDIVVFKLTSVGTLQWIVQRTLMNTDMDDLYSSITVDSFGNTYVAYHTQGTTSGGTLLGRQDIAVFKLDPSGQFEWIRQQTAMNTDDGDASEDDLHPTIACDISGNVYVSYSTKYVADGSSIELYKYTDTIVVFKLDTNGNFQWVRQPVEMAAIDYVNYDGNCYSPSITVDASGYPVIAYVTTKIVSGGITAGNYDIVAARLDPDGNLVWVKQQPSMNTENSDNAPSIKADASGNTYIAYYTNSGTASGGTNHGSDDIVVFKLNVDGDLLWVKQEYYMNTDVENQFPSIGVDSVGNVYVTYNTKGTVSGGVQTSEFNYDVVVFKLSTREAETNSFAGITSPYVTFRPVLVYTKETVDALVAGSALPATTRVSWAPLGVPAGSLFRDLRLTVIAKVSPTNPLHAYRFQRVQLIAGADTEGVGGLPTDTDAWQTGWICTWAASGQAPVF